MRTHQTWACECGLRQEKTDRCRRCGSERVGDLADPKTNAVAHDIAWKRWSAQSPPANGRQLIAVWIGVMSASGLCLVVSSPADLPTWVQLTTPVIAAFGVAAAFGVGRSRATPDKSVAFAHEIASPPIPGPDTTSFIGTVRAGATARSFLALEACVAWRVSGWACRARLDEAGLIDFDVVADDGRVATVRGGAATVLLPISEWSALYSLTDAQLQFLKDRGFWDPMGVTLGEAVLVPGQRVTIEGHPQRVPRPDGYRGTVEDLLFEDRPGYPLTIRAVE